MRLRPIPSALLILCCLLATSGCGSGQVAQTSSVIPSEEGANAALHGVYVRDVQIATPLFDLYHSGDAAPVYLTIATDEGVSDELVGVTTDAATSVVLVRSLLNPLPGPSDLSSASPAASPSNAPPAPSAAPTPSGSPSGEAVDLELAPGSLLSLGQGSGYLELRGLTHDLRVGDTVVLTFSFVRAGDITIEVPVATPDSLQERISPSASAPEG